MTGRSDASLVALLVTNRLVETSKKPLTAKEFWPLTREVDDLAQLLDTDTHADPDDGTEPPELAAVDHARLSALLESATALAFELERLENHGLWALSGIDDDYPSCFRDRLGDAAPPVLIGAGPAALLESGVLGVVGSRNVSEAGAEVARAAARAAASKSWTLVSGGARGVDQLSMHAAREAGGQVLGLLADGILRQVKEAEVRQALQAGEACFCSPYKPSAGFRAGNAMGRNKLIYAAADVTFVVASDHDSGGTWAGATEALRRSFGRVAVWRGDGEGPGNAALEQRGATPITEVGQLFEPLPDLQQAAPPEPDSEQLGLGLA